MFLRWIGVLALIGLLSVPVFGQELSSRVVLNNDIRLFAAAAALDVARQGRDSRFAGDLDPELMQQLQQFYAARKAGRSDESQYGAYFGLAISLTDPPELKPKFREEQLPDETRALLGFPPMLKQFYEQAHISQRWVELQPQYEAELRRLQLRVNDVLLQSDAYLRNTISGSGRQTLRIDSELAAPTGSVNMRVFQNDYYVMLGPVAASTTTTGFESIRHSYLHFQLDEVVNRSLARIENRERFLDLLSGQQGIDATYTHDFGLMAVESLIRAVELRMDRVTTVRAKDIVDGAYRSGLLLTPYFYDALLNFQNGTDAFREAFPQIAADIRFDTERTRFATTFQAIAMPARSTAPGEVREALATAAPPPDPVRELIKEAQAAYNNMDDEGAKALFQRVLRDHDPNNGDALYGLARLASRAADIEQSQLYFERTVKSSSADAASKVWSYIYLGHIADLQCQRERATEYYRQAVAIGDDSRGAQASAKSGLSQAFGDQCR